MRKIEYPTRIRWLTRGEGANKITESEKKSMIAESRRQIGILIQSMEFRNLQVGQSKVPIGPWLYECKSVAGLNSVTIRMVREITKLDSKVIVELCWCTCQMTSGIIKEIIPKDTGTQLCWPVRSSYYPSCCSMTSTNFAGLRYLVEVCQSGNTYIKIVCAATDYRTYEIKQKVVLLYIGSWIDLETCTNMACHILPKETEINELDGQLVILPYE